MTFRIGQKVICVSYEWDNIWWRIRAFFLPPPCGDLTVGEIYTVANIIWDNEHPDVPWTIEVIEAPHPANRWWEAGWDPKCFRPLVERKTDISVFKRMLIGNRHDHLERV
jgi:hypothetical protein